MNIIVRREVLQSEYTAIADDKGNKVTYKELADQAEKLSASIEERSLVFILCDHQTETAEFLYEVLYLNRVPLLLSSDIDMELFQNLITVYKPQYIYCKKQNQITERYYHEIEMEHHVLLKTDSIRYEIHPDVALLLSTSGTTGGAKLVKLSYDNLYNNSEFACRHLGIQNGQKGLSPLPINYTYGFAFCLWHWHCGASILLTEENVIGREFEKFYKKEKVNNFAAIPYTYQMLQRVQFWDSEKTEYLHFAMSGGAQMSDNDQVSLISILKDKFWIGYGQTECTCIISAMNFENHNIKLGSIGRAFDNMEVIVDSETQEMLIKSKSVCMGYATYSRELAAGDMNQGLLHTGDTVYIDEEGCIYLKGRLKRFIKILGKRVSLDDIGNYLANKYPDVDFACIGTDNELSIFYTSLEAGLKEEIKMLLEQSMKVPSKFISCLYIKKLPRNSAGKIAYTKLEEIRNGDKE